MAWDDDRERVATERLSNGARRTWSAEPDRDFTVGHRAPGRNAARKIVDALVERLDAGGVEDDERQIRGLAAQQRDNRIDGALHVGRRRLFARIGEAPIHPCAARSN